MSVKEVYFFPHVDVLQIEQGGMDHLDVYIGVFLCKPVSHLFQRKFLQQKEHINKIFQP